MSKTASGNGRSSRARLAYKPVSGERKSGIPADVLIPAPVYRRNVNHHFSHLQLGMEAYHHYDLFHLPIFDQ